jgi:hypothetical protein
MIVIFATIFMLKKLTIYSIIALLSVAISFETVNYFFKKMNLVLVIDVEDLDCEEKNSESEKATEKFHFINELFDMACLSLNAIDIAGQNIPQNIHFSSSDYSQVVYSPPEII